MTTNQTLKLKKAEAWPIVKQAFPGYKGRTFKVDFSETVTFWDTNWGGGSRNSYAAVRTDGHSQHLSVDAPWANPVEGVTVDLPPNAVVVKHTIFCGKDLGITIHAHPCHRPRWLT